eukprot:COSAG02_NODE_102_length_36716_cov_233.851025_1_plen_87_part_10
MRKYTATVLRGSLLLEAAEHRSPRAWACVVLLRLLECNTHNHLAPTRSPCPHAAKSILHLFDVRLVLESSHQILGKDKVKFLCRGEF